MATKLKAVKGTKIKIPNPGKIPKMPKMAGKYPIRTVHKTALKIPKLGA